jgi:hypothetical protein
MLEESALFTNGYPDSRAYKAALEIAIIVTNHEIYKNRHNPTRQEEMTPILQALRAELESLEGRS